VLTPRNAIIMAERVPASSLVRFTGGGHGRMYQDAGVGRVGPAVLQGVRDRGHRRRL